MAPDIEDPFVVNRAPHPLLRFAARLFLFALAVPAALQAQRTVALTSSVNPKLRRAVDQGRVAPDTRLDYVTLILKRDPEKRQALERLLVEQLDPVSPNYRRWLTPEVFGQRFGATLSELSRLAAWLQSRGFTVGATARGRGWITFGGTAAQLENAFRVELHRYRMDGRAYFANAGPPSVPYGLADLVAGIRGLDDFYPEAPPHPQPFYFIDFMRYALAPADFAAIYDIASLYGSGIDGTGQNISIVGESPIHLDDIASFRQRFGLPTQVPQVTLVGPQPPINTGAEIEADLDLEWSGAVAPNASLSYVYARNVLDAAAHAIDNNLAPILSYSYGICEPDLSDAEASARRDLAQQASSQGITWIVSSGDGGGAECDQGNVLATHGLAVSSPASLPEVTGVGGTTFREGSSMGRYWDLAAGSALSYIPALPWNDTGPVISIGASGGGASILYPKPYWQTGIGVPNNSARNVPDISLAASPAHDPYVMVSGEKTIFVGGTSASAPAFAGIVALLSQYLVANGSQGFGLGNINPILYGLAEVTTDVFHDIVSGSNAVGCQPSSVGCPAFGNTYLGYPAGPGYDQATGLGSLDVANLILEWDPSLAIAPPSQPPPAPILVLPGNGVSDTSLRISLSWHVAGNATAYDVYFGPNPQPAFWGTTAGNTCMPSGLAAATTYYWRVVAKNGAGSASSSIWSFTTGAPQTISELPASFPDPVSVAVSPRGDLYIADLATNRVYEVSKGVYSIAAGDGVALFGPAAVAADGSGNFYIAEWRRDRVLEVSNGIISVVAGSNGGFSGDGGPAASALLSAPMGVAVDASGNIYVADTENNRVREISGGIITTVAGNGTFGDGGDNGPATHASLSSPKGLAVDVAGNLYIADVGNHRIRKVSNGVITTVAGTGAPGFSGDGGPAISAALKSPTGVAFDAAGNLYIADSENSRVRRVSHGIINTVAGNGNWAYGGDGGPASLASLALPEGVAVDTEGKLYIADPQNAGVRVVTLSPAAQPPSPIRSTALLNAASSSSDLAPGSIATVWGSFALNPPAQAQGPPFAAGLSGLSLQFSGIPAPLFYASASQANLQIPWETAGQPQVTLVPALNGQLGIGQTVKLAAFAPGIFTVNGQGTGQGAILDSNYRLVDTSHPAGVGAMIQIYCTGLGPVTDPPPSGSPASSASFSTTTVPPKVTIGGLNAPVLFSGLAPGTVGLYQINVTVPAGTARGNSVPLVVSIGGATSNTVSLAIQ